jgi:hypothetical protein
MRKHVMDRRSVANIIPFAKPGDKRECSVEVGIDEKKGCIYLRMGGVGGPCVAMTADRAENFAAHLQNFVFELRNGGALT